MQLMDSESSFRVRVLSRDASSSSIGSTDRYIFSGDSDDGSEYHEYGDVYDSDYDDAYSEDGLNNNTEKQKISGKYTPPHSAESISPDRKSSNSVGPRLSSVDIVANLFSISDEMRSERYSNVHIHFHAYIHAYVHPYMYTYTYTYIHTYTYVHIFIQGGHK